MPYKVHVFGPSTLHFSDTTPGDSLLGLTQEALAESWPEGEWHCSATLLYLAPNIAARVEEVVERELPDLVLLRLPDMQLLQDYVVYRIRERWPSLYRPAVRISRWLNDLAGGGPRGARRFRGWIFRAPRWLLANAIGVAPAMRVDEAVESVRQTLDMLGRREDLQVVYSLPMPTVPPNIPAQEARRRGDEFARGVSQYCIQKRIPCLDPGEVRGRAGISAGLAKDRWHPDLENRRLDARILAHAISQARDGATTLDIDVAAGEASAVSP